MVTKDLTVLYLTDSKLEENLAERCRELLLPVIDNSRLISVSQKPLNFGENICVGDIGKSGVSFDTQILAGAKEIKTRWIAVAEHDCIYPSEHFRFIPPDELFFWYNINVWFVQYHNPNHPELNGQYSYWPKRRAHSQLICDSSKYLESCQLRLEITSDPFWRKRYPTGRIGEPGAAHYNKSKSLSNPSDVKHNWPKLKQYVNGYIGKDFKTTLPTIDIRHGDNFSGPRRGKRRTFDLYPYGDFYKFINLPNPPLCENKYAENNK